MAYSWVPSGALSSYWTTACWPAAFSGLNESDMPAKTLSGTPSTPPSCCWMALTSSSFDFSSTAVFSDEEVRGVDLAHTAGPPLLGGGRQPRRPCCPEAYANGHAVHRLVAAGPTPGGPASGWAAAGRRGPRPRRWPRRWPAGRTGPRPRRRPCPWGHTAGEQVAADVGVGAGRQEQRGAAPAGHRQQPAPPSSPAVLTASW